MQKLLRKLLSVKPCVTAADLAAFVRSTAKLAAARQAERQAYQRAQCRCRYPGVLCGWCETTLVPLVPTAASIAAQRLRADRARNGAAS